MTTFLAIASIIELLIIGALCYSVYNLLKKLDFWENKYKLTLIITQRMADNMKQIDSLGAFEADDEVGSTFQDLKSLVDEYRDNIK